MATIESHVWARMPSAVAEAIKAQGGCWSVVDFLSVRLAEAVS